MEVRHEQLNPNEFSHPESFQSNTFTFTIILKAGVVGLKTSTLSFKIKIRAWGDVNFICNQSTGWGLLWKMVPRVKNHKYRCVERTEDCRKYTMRSCNFYKPFHESLDRWRVCLWYKVVKIHVPFGFGRWAWLLMWKEITSLSSCTVCGLIKAVQTNDPHHSNSFLLGVT